MGCGRSEVSWLGAPRRAFPGNRRFPSGSLRRLNARSQWRDRAGLSPDFPRPPADERGHPTPPAGRPPRGQLACTPLESPAGRPPSSRGLGRRPLTAETGVRIPVAVLREPAPGAGLRVQGVQIGLQIGLRWTAVDRASPQGCAPSPVTNWEACSNTVSVTFGVRRLARRPGPKTATKTALTVPMAASAPTLRTIQS
jgi:hypothetical protein